MDIETCRGVLRGRRWGGEMQKIATRVSRGKILFLLQYAL